MAGALNPGLSTGQEYSVVFLGKALYSCSVSLHPGGYWQI